MLYEILNLKSHSLIKTFYEKGNLEILSFEEIKNYYQKQKTNIFTDNYWNTVDKNRKNHK